MLFSSLFLLAGTALALPATAPRDSNAACMTRDDGKAMVEVYKNLIANYTDADCTKYCSEDFADYSDSINTFIHQPLGGPVFATKKIFMEAQELNPPFPLVVDSIDAVDCTFIALRWHATFGEAMLPNKGLTVLETTNVAGWWQIKVIDTEFNGLTWLRDMGGSYSWDDTTYGPTGTPAT